ncbi:MAG: DUF2127 domain-containing protein [Actinomycetota bacterium]|nr:DUF2127 domain-containing protein [Actinomycetota bacterium]
MSEPGQAQPARDRLLPWIAGERLVRGLVLVAVGVVLVTHVHTDWGQVLRDEAARWGFHPVNNGIGRLLEKLSGVSSRHIAFYGSAAIAYGLLEGVEGYGLWRRRRWGEWLTVLATSLLFIPEIAELLSHPTAFKVAAILVNAGIVVYLITRLREPRRAPARPLP